MIFATRPPRFCPPAEWAPELIADLVDTRMVFISAIRLDQQSMRRDIKRALRELTFLVPILVPIGVKSRLPRLGRRH
jgi:hypothetical protein